MENSVIWNNCLLDQILKLFMYSLDFNPMMLCVHKIDKHMLKTCSKSAYDQGSSTQEITTKSILLKQGA